MVKILKKIKHIFIGWWYSFRGINYELMQSRLNICNNCEHHVRIMKNVYVCSICGCFTDKKARVKDESCSLKKW